MESNIQELMPEQMQGKLKELGWSFDDFYITKDLGKYKVTIEFCIGDMCVSIWENLELKEPKRQCHHLIEALVEAMKLEKKYVH